ncbi:MAG: YabP/YqfC family sporulation protein [Clostridiales bacterium]|jgi:sporulation protein YabP|nr:YabP/YqfC family sporulation protein [Clostridiales bacterium]
MQDNTRQPSDNKSHTLTLDSRSKGTITGVDKVVSSNDTSILLHTTQGVIQILGKDFKIRQFSQDNGVLHFEGEVDSIKYSGKTPQKGNMLKRMFK